MPKTIVQDVGRQLRQLGGNIFETAAKQPGEIAGKALEQLGLGGGKPAPGQVSQTAVAQQKEQIAKAGAEDKAQSEKQVSQIAGQLKQIEAEMDKQRKMREQQLAERRAAEQQALPPADEESGVPPVVSSRRSRGMFGGFGRRVKSAQQQSQPETAGRRVGG